MFDVGKINRISREMYQAKPTPITALALVRAATQAMIGLEVRREELSDLIAYTGAQQWDKDAARYRFWLATADVTITKVLDQQKAGGETDPDNLWVQKYKKTIAEMFTGGLRARAGRWATFANQLAALEGAEQDMSTQVSWMVKWWAMPAAELAADIATAYDMQENLEDFAQWKEKVIPQAKQFIRKASNVALIVGAGAAIWFGWPLIAAAFAASGPRKRPG